MIEHRLKLIPNPLSLPQTLSLTLNPNLSAQLLDLVVEHELELFELLVVALQLVDSPLPLPNGVVSRLGLESGLRLGLGSGPGWSQVQS